VPHKTNCHTTHINVVRTHGDHFLNPAWVPPLESHIAWCRHDEDVFSAPIIQTKYTMHFSNQTVMISWTYIICLLPLSNNGILCHVRRSSIGIRALIWIASGMKHWKRMTKISRDTDYYYCIILKSDVLIYLCHMTATLILDMKMNGPRHMIFSQVIFTVT